MSLLHSTGSVVAGFLSVAVLSVVTDGVLEQFGVFPSQTQPEAYLPWMLVVALVYRSAYTVLGGYITARLAPGNIMKHVYMLMGLGTIGGVAGMIQGWSYGNHWYPALLAATGPLWIWIGGSLFLRRNALQGKGTNEPLHKGGV